MAWNSLAPLQALDALAAGLSGVQQTYIGVPESGAARLIAYTWLAGQDVDDKTSGGLLVRHARYRTIFSYALDTDEASAETVLAAVVDAWAVAIYSARPAWKANAALGNIESVNLALGDDPIYAVQAGDERREYPVEITVQQQQSVSY